MLQTALQRLRGAASVQVGASASLQYEVPSRG